MSRHRRALASLGYIASFGAARGSLFIAPVLLANLLPIEAYGVIEFSQAVASLLALVLGMGLQATVPLILLRPEVSARWDTLLWLISRLSWISAGVALAIGLSRGNLFSTGTLIGLGTAVLLLQGFWSITLKSHERGTAAVFLEACYWIVTTAAASLIVFLNGPLWIISLSLLIYGSVLMLKTFRTWKAEAHPFARSDLLKNIQLGLPLMAISLLTLLVSSSGRLILGVIAPLETVGLYAVLYRATALPLVGHQLLIIGLFRQLFVWDIPVLQKRAPIIVIGVGFCVALFWLTVPHLGWMLGDVFNTAFSKYPLEGHLILAMTVLWSAVALNDLLVSRLQIAGNVAAYAAGYLTLGLPLLFWLTSSSKQEALFSGFVLNYMVLMFGYYLVQCFGIWRQGHVFALLWTSAFGVTSITCALTFLLYSS